MLALGHVYTLAHAYALMRSDIKLGTDHVATVVDAIALVRHRQLIAGDRALVPRWEASGQAPSLISSELASLRPDDSVSSAAQWPRGFDLKTLVVGDQLFRSNRRSPAGSVRTGRSGSKARPVSADGRRHRDADHAALRHLVGDDPDRHEADGEAAADHKQGH